MFCFTSAVGLCLSEVDGVDYRKNFRAFATTGLGHRACVGFRVWGLGLRVCEKVVLMLVLLSSILSRTNAETDEATLVRSVGFTGPGGGGCVSLGLGILLGNVLGYFEVMGWLCW